MDASWILFIVVGYLLGSIPFALVIGKLFFNTDVRNFGSGNLGGSNVGRVLGRKAGIAVIILDVLKVVVAVAIVSMFNKEASFCAGLAASVGHCFPIFAGFRGGKAVATMFGTLLSASIFTFGNAWYFVVPLLFFGLTLFISKIISLSSMVAAISSSIFITIMQASISTETVVASWLLTILVLSRHKKNIKRILQGTENKITWL